MKTLLGKLIKPKSDTTLDQLAWMRGMEDKDDVAVLQQSVQFLSVFYDDTSLSAPERVRILTKLDQLNRTRIDSLSYHYSESHNLRPEISKVFADTIYFYQRHLYRNYQRIVSEYHTFAAELPDNMKALNLFIGRAMYALFESHKLRYFNQQGAPDGSWQLIFNLYKIGESADTTSVLFRLYEKGDPVSINDIFVQGCMLDTLYQANLNKQQIRIASVLLSKFLTNTEISSQNDDEHILYHVDMRLDKGARRIRSQELNPDCRFWRTDGLSLKIHKVLLAVHHKKSLETTIISQIHDHPALLSTVIFLDSEWSKLYYKRQRRKEERRKVSKRAVLVYGFDELRELVKHLTAVMISKTNKGYVKSEKTLDERLQAHTVNLNHTPKAYFKDIAGEAIMIIDESEKGLGFKISKPLSEWSTQGNLIGLSTEENREEIIIGLIKSSKQINNRDSYLGIEKLSSKPFWVEMSPMSADGIQQSSPMGNFKSPTVLSEPSLSFSGLYFVSEFDNRNASYVFIPRAAFVKDAHYQINLFGKFQIVKLKHVLEMKQDWSLASIEQIKPS